MASAQPPNGAYVRTYRFFYVSRIRNTKMARRNESNFDGFILLGWFLRKRPKFAIYSFSSRKRFSSGLSGCFLLARVAFFFLPPLRYVLLAEFYSRKLRLGERKYNRRGEIPVI